MFNRKSDYALNKLSPDAIVYRSASGVHIRLTCKDFASEEEFLRWKDWSDGSYCEIERSDASYSKHTCGLPEWHGSVQSPEAAVIEAQDQKERQELCRLLQEGLDSCLTPVQRRRLWLYCVEGLTVRQIAQAEGASFQSIAKAVAAAKKKMGKFLRR